MSFKQQNRVIQGVLLGNPFLGNEVVDDSRVDYFYYHGFIGRPLYEKLKSCKSEQKHRDCYRPVSLYILIHVYMPY